jgi:hypothetical protein
LLGGGAFAASETWCLELHSGTTLPLLAAVYRNAGARFFVSMFARGRSNHKVFQKLIVQTNNDLEMFKIVIKSAINALKR